MLWSKGGFLPPVGMTGRTYPVKLLGAIIVTALWVILASVGVLGWSMPVAAQTTEHEFNQAGLIVVHEDGTVTSRCVGFTDETISGYELLVRGDFALRSEVGSMGAEICSLDGEGCGEGEDCFCQCQTSVCRYWTYWQLGPDGWRYSSIGASNSSVGNGAVDGWVWGDSRPNGPSENPPPQLTFADICSADATIYGVASRTSYGFSPDTMSQSWVVALVVAIPLLLGGGWWLLRQRRRVQP
jgi:hypothetical protein